MPEKPVAITPGWGLRAREAPSRRGRRLLPYAPAGIPSRSSPGLSCRPPRHLHRVAAASPRAPRRICPHLAPASAVPLQHWAAGRSRLERGLLSSAPGRAGSTRRFTTCSSPRRGRLRAVFSRAGSPRMTCSRLALGRREGASRGGDRPLPDPGASAHRGRSRRPGTNCLKCCLCTQSPRIQVTASDAGLEWRRARVLAVAAADRRRSRASRSAGILRGSRVHGELVAQRKLPMLTGGAPSRAPAVAFPAGDERRRRRSWRSWSWILPGARTVADLFGGAGRSHVRSPGRVRARVSAFRRRCRRDRSLERAAGAPPGAHPGAAQAQSATCSPPVGQARNSRLRRRVYRSQRQGA